MSYTDPVIILSAESAGMACTIASFRPPNTPSERTTMRLVLIAALLLCCSASAEAATTVVTRDFVIAYSASAPPTPTLAGKAVAIPL